MNNRNNNHVCHECGGELSAEFNFNPLPNLRSRRLARLHPSHEMELAMELLSVSSEAELDHFLGKMFKKVWGGIKKVGSFVGKAVKPFAGALKALAKKALPFVGKALGSFIPIPGVGTAIGGALGGALAKALEMEFAILEQAEQEFEMARRFVRIAHSATSQLADADPNQPIAVILRQVLNNATRQHMPRATQASQRGAASIGSQGFGFTNSGTNSGTWQRERGYIVFEV
jgi:hypothetical protein